MAIVIKKTDDNSDALPLYTNSLETTKLFIGLGNPGDKYYYNRHNVGFMCLDYFAQTYSLNWQNKPDFQCLFIQTTMGGTRIILCKPQTYMNLSGQSVQSISHFYSLNPMDTFIIHDEIRLDLGTIETTTTEQNFGHNGLKSIHNIFADQLNLIRIGIGPKIPANISLTNFVLSDFPEHGDDKLQTVTKEVTSIMGEISGGHFNQEKRKVLY